MELPPSPSESRLRHAMLTLSDGVLNRADPLGARCILAVLESAGQNVGLFLQDRLQTRDAIAEAVLAHRPDVVWVSIQPGTRGVGRFLARLDEALRCVFVLGNVGAAALAADELAGLRCPCVTVVGQGEDAVAALIPHLLRSGPALDVEALRDVPNLRWLRGAGLVSTPARPSVRAKGLVPSALGLREAVARGDIIAARSSSGCNANCTFCTVRAINNGQTWKPNEASALTEWLRRLVAAGMTAGSVAMTDDDLAGSVENLESVATSFEAVNALPGVALRFSFSTRAEHLVAPRDDGQQADRRQRAWRRAVQAGLQAVFLGLESGSDTQLKRLGKGSSAATNYAAVDFANTLGIRVEVGFIPIDPFMPDGGWRQEMLDNVRLARHARVAETSPTWLAPARAYRGSPLYRWLVNAGLLGEAYEGTDEHAVNYRSAEVVQFLEDLGPVLCEGGENGYYRFKREFKALQRYPEAVFQHCWELGEAVIESELRFVEALLAAPHRESTRAAQRAFARSALALLQGLDEALTAVRHLAHAEAVLRWVRAAASSLSGWRAGLREAEAVPPAVITDPRDPARILGFGRGRQVVPLSSQTFQQ